MALCDVPFSRSSAGNVSRTRQTRRGTGGTCPNRVAIRWSAARTAHAHVRLNHLPPRGPCFFHSLIILDDRGNNRTDGQCRMPRAAAWMDESIFMPWERLTNDSEIRGLAGGANYAEPTGSHARPASSRVVERKRERVMRRRGMTSISRFCG